MSKRFQADGQSPCKILLVGDTRSDPRALEQANANASEIARFQIAARDNAIRNGLPQSKVRRTTSTGIQLNYQYNNGLEVLLVYVPLTNPQPAPTTQPNTQSPCVAVLDVLFPCDPYLATFSSDGTHWTYINWVMRHTAWWASGVTIQSADITSISPFGASSGNTSLAAGAEVSAEVFGHDMSDLQFGPDMDGPSVTLGYDTNPVQLTGSPTNLSWNTPSNEQFIYRETVGSSYLIDPTSLAPLSINVYLAHANMYDNAISGFPGVFFRQTPRAPIIVRVREFNRTDTLNRVSVNVTETILTVHAAATPPDQGVADTSSTSTTTDSMPPWHFIASNKFEAGDGVPADPSQNGMGSVIYASDTDSALAYTYPGQNEGTSFAVTGYNMRYASYPLNDVAGPPTTMLYDSMSYSGDASAMTQFATIQWTPGATAGGGKVTATYL